MAMGYQNETEMKGTNLGSAQTEPVIGIPYAYPPPAHNAYGYVHNSQMAAPVHQDPFHQVNYVASSVPANAILDNPGGIALLDTVWGDTPAPFVCPHCGTSGMTNVKSTPSLAACVACMMSLVGVCFLCPAFDCLWDKKHYCPQCRQKVAEFKKSDPCLVVDPKQWSQPSYGIPA